MSPSTLRPAKSGGATDGLHELDAAAIGAVAAYLEARTEDASRLPTRAQDQQSLLSPPNREPIATQAPLRSSNRDEERSAPTARALRLEARASGVGFAARARPSRESRGEDCARPPPIRECF